MNARKLEATDPQPAPAGGRSRHARRPAARRGAALFILLVFLGLAAIFITGWLTSAAAERRLNRLAEERLQAGWLAESGIERAAAQLARDAAYQGETWQAPAAELGGDHHALVTIKIDRGGAAAGDGGTSVQATVEVQLRDGDETVARARKQVSIRRSKSEESP